MPRINIPRMIRSFEQEQRTIRLAADADQDMVDATAVDELLEPQHSSELSTPSTAPSLPPLPVPASSPTLTPLRLSTPSSVRSEYIPEQVVRDVSSPLSHLSVESRTHLIGLRFIQYPTHLTPNHEQVLVVSLGVPGLKRKEEIYLLTLSTLIVELPWEQIVPPEENQPFQ
ncbi:hypothetical protein FS749_010666 [Ceratobasidium sp. UAMH 11750]|nr:hypothetical protein FS749_010666 [Ceratobasidium sp. UAMH 11750]